MVDDDAGRLGDPEAAVAAFAALPFPVMVTEGADARIVAFNPAVQAISGQRIVAGLTVRELFPDLVGQGWIELYERTPLTGETTLRDEMRMQLIQADGERAEFHLDIGVLPYRAADDALKGAVAFARDVTARVEARRALEAEVEALRRASEQARGATRAMQRALLADSVPLVPDLDVAARYVLAADEQVAGGDWFDAIVRPDGTVGLVVGDVVGHGTTASVAMGQLRTLVRARLLAGASVGDALADADQFASHAPAARRATICAATFDPTSGLLTYCTAGHPPPLVVSTDDDRTRFLPATGAGPLATGGGFPLAATTLEPDEVTVLYTDGILERPGVRLEAATVELREVASNAHRNVLMPAGASPRSVERICALSIELLTRFSGQADDITILAAHRRREAVAPLVLVLDVEPSAAATARTRLRSWITELGTDAMTEDVLVHAINELVANVVDHAHRHRAPEPFQVTARLHRDGRVRLQVADRGRWLDAPVGSDRGVGLSVVRQLTERLEVDAGRQGTTVTVHHRPSRPAGLLDLARPRIRPREPELFDVWVAGAPDPVIGVVGPLDVRNVAELSTHVALALTEARDVVTIDLSDVTLLASAGVNLLFAIRDQARTKGVRFQLIAPAGSPAQQILALVRLDHRAADPSPP